MRRVLIHRRVAGCVAAAWLAMPAIAQEQPVVDPAPVPPVAPVAETAPEATTRRVHFSLAARGRLGLVSELDEEEGDVSVTRLGAALGANIAIGARSRLDLSLSHEHSHYEWSSDATLVPGTSEPFEDVGRTFLTARFSSQASQRVSWFVGGGAGIAAEDGADIGKSYEGTAFAGVRYAVNPTLSVGFGAGVATQLEDDPLFIPVITLDWQITDEWSLSSAGRPGLTLAYTPNDAWSFQLSGIWQNRDFRLDDDGPVPDGVGRESSIDAMLGVVYTPTRQMEIQAGVGAEFARSFEVDDEDGDEIADADTAPAPFLGIEITFRF